MFENVAEVLRRYDELSELLATPQVSQDPDLIRKYGREQSEIEEMALTYRNYLAATHELAETGEMLSDEPDAALREMVDDEIKQLKERIEQYSEKLTELLLPKDPRDDRSVIVEIRAGTGGEEAALFAADLFRMYSRYAERLNWKEEVL